MTVVEIAVDLIRERDQLKKRIEQQQEVVRTQLLRTEELTNRIVKAREILRELALPDQYRFYIVTSPEHYRKDMQRALEALEGK